MSTLALEEFTMLHDGEVVGCAVYCCATFVIGCALAYVGALAGMWICDAERGAGCGASDGEAVR